MDAGLRRYSPCRGASLKVAADEAGVKQLGVEYLDMALVCAAAFRQLCRMLPLISICIQCI